jgi:serine/threonine protein kinase
MYFEADKTNYNATFDNISLHEGVPKEYYNIRHKVFGDWEIPPWELFIFKDRHLGSGSFSDVYLAKWRETFVVAKVMNNMSVQMKKELITREIETMTKMHHPNIVQFLGYIENPFIIILEYMPKGDLTNFIPKLYKSEKIKLAKDILRGLIYIHNRKPYPLIHRDIKTSNILLTEAKTAKIADFGLSKFYTIDKNLSSDNLTSLESNYSKSELTNEVGTERYMAPEILNQTTYNYKADIYSCGIVLYELFENKIYYPQYGFSWSKCPKKIKHIIIDHMLNYESEKRSEAIDIIKLF